MFSTHPVMALLVRATVKFVLATTVLVLLSLYPVWTAMATGGLIYLSVVSIITIEQALIGTACLSFAQSLWLAKIKYEHYTSNQTD